MGSVLLNGLLESWPLLLALLVLFSYRFPANRHLGIMIGTDCILCVLRAESIDRLIASESYFE